MNFPTYRRKLKRSREILKAKKALTDMQSGEVLKVLATDPGSVRDFQAFAKQTGNTLLEHVQLEKEFTFYLQRKVGLK